MKNLAAVITFLIFFSGTSNYPMGVNKEPEKIILKDQAIKGSMKQLELKLSTLDSLTQSIQ